MQDQSNFDRTGAAEQQDELRAAALTQLKKKADLRVHLLIYVLVNGMLVVIWAMTGAHFFWPIFVIAGWGVGVVANVWDVYLTKAPTESQIQHEMERLARRR